MSSAATVGALAMATSCGKQSLAPLEEPEDGHVVARPGAPVFAPRLGVSDLGLGSGRDGQRFIPSTYRDGDVLPLLLTLHGAGGDGYRGMQRFLAFAESARVVLVSPDSRDVSWDRRYGRFAADTRFINNALSDTFLRCAIDPQKIAIAGFSDGASYALSLGLTNGDLFQRIVAFSPGFMRPNVGRGKPTSFVSHGTRDPILPIATSSRVIVPELRSAGYDVTYREFDGTHEVPVAIANESFQWLQGGWGISQ